MSKIKVAIICGGQSGEHEVSLTSAYNIVNALDKKKYDIHIIGIKEDGTWHYMKENFILYPEDPKNIALGDSSAEVVLTPSLNKKHLVCLGNTTVIRHEIDIAIPVLHGTFGEDGTIQGLFEMAGIAYVGSGVLGSAISMDKVITKKLLMEAGIPTSKFEVIYAQEQEKSEELFHDISKKLGMPLFVKPANLGSSVAISKVKNLDEWKRALCSAFEYDTKVIVEEFIEGREIECAVLGNEKAVASVPGEIIPKHEFYSYEAKYLDANGAELEAPAKLDKKTELQIKKLATEVFKTTCASGLARVDFFLKKDGSIYCNEINTFPGFTKISMYPRLWELSGISYPQLLDKLIKLGLDRFNARKNLKVTL